ncbi:transporter substrate-binding domain-containing protein [Parasalinivibrio latis]|uniref:substrate-binding periplasmic protein n=1 Tax=Parasalinivibrio latis TaxID=2952610 RepID=UPI0030E439A7
MAVRLKALNNRLIRTGLAGLLIVLTGTIPFSAAGRSFDDIIESGEITVAVYADFPPYSFVDGENKPDGIDIGIAKFLAEGLGVQLKLHWVTPDENVEDDMRNHLWKGMNLTSEDGKRVKADVMLRIPYDREYSQLRDDVGLLVHERVHMFAPYQVERWQIAYNPVKLEAVPTMAVFQYHPIGVEVDTVPQFYLTTAFAGRMRGNTHSFHAIADAYDAMLKGEVDAVMGMRSQVQWLNANGNGKSELAENGFPMLGKQQWEIGMAVQGDYRQLAYALEDALVVKMQNGELQKLIESYGVVYQVPGVYQ